jgi:SAM-dependent methyltransferase
VRGTFEHLPLRSRSCDRVLSLAALHHVVDLSPFCEEAWRVLAPGGVLCIADAASDSPVAEFLNVFVHRHNSMGHVGRFLDGSVAATLADVGFHVERAAIVPYTWRFASPDAMVAFTQLLFGLDRATPEEVRAGIAHHLGYCVEDGCCHLRWELLFLRAVKR